MNFWCKCCRRWVDAIHLDLSCANGKERYHPDSPLCGDIWQLSNGHYAVVDYHMCDQTGITVSDGKKVIRRFAYYYTNNFREFLKREQAKLVTTCEEFPYPCGVKDGWTDSEYKPDADDFNGSRSIQFLKTILESKAVL